MDSIVGLLFRLRFVAHSQIIEQSIVIFIVLISAFFKYIYSSFDCATAKERFIHKSCVMSIV